jgi:tRNA dimethylallyltransferase
MARLSAPGPGEGAPVALIGTTASGKSELARAVARRMPDVEIVSVDSMCVYRGMDGATAKPTTDDRRRIRHHLIDLVDPSEEFTVSMFQAAASRAIADIERRGGRPLLVGGTGLYLRAVVDDLRLPGRWPEVAADLEREADGPDGVEGLHRKLVDLDPVAAARMTPTNRRRVVRALEVTLGSGRRFSSFGPGLEAYPPTRFLLVGLPFEAGTVDRRIEERFDGWMAAGLLDEVRALATRPAGLSRTARQALGYRELLAHVEEGRPLHECVDEAVRRTRAYARRQWAWMRRDPRVRWVTPGTDSVGEILAALRGRPDAGVGPGLPAAVGE